MSRRQGPARKLLDRDEIRRLRSEKTLVFDQRRRRPRYFDGRFLDARDLTREQNYFLGRQATLGRALGAGVIQGLMVEQGPSASTLQIGAGHGLTSDGELVALGSDLRLDLADIAEHERLDAAFGLRRLPRPSARLRSGLFILALRAVEFTANPIGSYPRSLGGKRSIEDGDIIEASAVTLIPFPDEGERERTGRRRAAAARRIFVEDAPPGAAAGVLPLAMLAIDRGVILWIDPFLVFRELGSDRGALSLGFAARGVASAYLQQYDLHIRQVVAERRENNQPLRFAAAEHFLTLPPAGRLPAAAVDPEEFTQHFFPPEVEVDLAPVPVDEVPTLLEEALLLPPVELRREVDEIGSTAVQILIPVERPALRRLAATLSSLSRDLKPVAPGQLARRLPLANLRGLKLARLAAPPAADDDTETAAWRKILAAADWLWYARHRNVRLSAAVLGVAVAVNGPDTPDNPDQPDQPDRPDRPERPDRPPADELRERLLGLQLNSAFSRLRDSATRPGAEAMTELLTEPEIIGSNMFLRGAVREIELAGDRPNATTVGRTRERFLDDEVLKGRLLALEVIPDLEDRVTPQNSLAAIRRVPDYFKILTRIDDDQQRADQARKIIELASQTGRDAQEQLTRAMQRLAAEFDL